MSKCKHCKKEISENSKFCTHCGKKHHKEEEVYDPYYTKATGRGVAFFIFGVIIIVSLFSLSFMGFIVILLSVLGIIVALPNFNKLTKKKFKKVFPTWSKVLTIIVIFFLAVMLLGNDSDKQEQPKELNLKSMSSEQVLDNYLDLLNYNGVNELLSNNLQRQKLSSGTVKENLALDYNYRRSLQKEFEDLQDLCNQLKQLGSDACNGGIYDLLTLKETNTMKLISTEVVDESKTEAKIRVKFNVVNENGKNSTKVNRDITYILKKEDKVWKVDNYMDDDGKLLSEKLDIEKQKEDYQKSLEEMKSIFSELKKPIGQMKGIYQLAGNLQTKVQNALPDNRIIDFDFGSYNNQTDKFVIGVTYYFKEQWLVDDYLGFLGDAEKIYKAIFTNSNQIMQVQITAKQKYKDDYGKEQEKFLGRSLMTKTTADKISWEGFESSSLDKIASVSFYGDSFYKELTDLQNDLDNWQSVPNYGGGFGSLPSSVCSDAKSQCQAYGECDTLDMLKSQGMC
jgi:hypothetical protein